MKTMMTSMCAVALLAGCASNDPYASSQVDIYREQWNAPTFQLLPDQQQRVATRRNDLPIVAERREPREITQTARANAMRIRAVRQREMNNNFQAMLNQETSTQPPIVSGSVAQSARREQELMALSRQPLPMAPGDAGLAPVGERLRGRSPVATSVPGRPGYVISPFSSAAGYVDVSGMSPGSQARDPYTGRIFTVP